MRLNLTLPGLGGGAKKTAAVDPMPMVKKRYWTPDAGDYEKFDYGTGGGRSGTGYGGSSAGTKAPVTGPGGSNYQEGDPWYQGKAWDKKTGKWINVNDDIYRKDAESGEQLLWQPASEPKKKGLLK